MSAPRSFWRTAVWVAVFGILITALLLGAFLVWGLPAILPDGTIVHIDGERIDMGQMRPAHPGHWLMASLGVLVAAAVIFFVVPLVIMLVIAVPLFFGALGLAIAAIVLGLVASPLVLLAWWLWKEPKRRAAGP